MPPLATMLQVMALPKTGNVSLQLWRAERITRERGILEWITNTLLENKHQGKYLLFPGYCHKKTSSCINDAGEHKGADNWKIMGCIFLLLVFPLLGHTHVMTRIHEF